MSGPSVEYTKGEVGGSAKEVGIGWVLKDFVGHVEGFELIFQGHSVGTRHD